MNKKSFLLLLIIFQISPMLQCMGHQTFTLKLKNKRITNFQQALAHLYTQKPHLLQPQQPLDFVANTTNTHSWKNILTHAVTILPLLYICYGTYENYSNHNKRFQESYLHQAILSNFPSLFVNTPRHISFFLQEIELLLQAYLLKLFLKMIVFCFG